MYGTDPEPCELEQDTILDKEINKWVERFAANAKFLNEVYGKEVAVSTGKEDKDPILDLKSWHDCRKSWPHPFHVEWNPWKERGAGTVKSPKHKVYEEEAISTGEEDEDPILDLKSKLYQFDKEWNQWTERGAGTVKFLKHKVTGKVRLVMRQSKTLKICANHLILPTMTVQEHAGNEKSCVWHATDFADGELKDELFCSRFASIENCKTFMETFQEVAESQSKKEENKYATAAAGLLENLSVEEKKSEDKAEKQETASEKEKESKDEPEKKAEEKRGSQRTKLSCKKLHLKRKVRMNQRRKQERLLSLLENILSMKSYYFATWQA